jgi:hypothetical protein
MVTGREHCQRRAAIEVLVPYNCRAQHRADILSTNCQRPLSPVHNNGQHHPSKEVT